ncbi:MAG TPA: S8 family serine peptidase [Pseudomonadales bacterium]|nr:S8 family serine peptidase [Pseudomonadales bacterium]
MQPSKVKLLVGLLSVALLAGCASQTQDIDKSLSRRIMFTVVAPAGKNVNEGKMPVTPADADDKAVEPLIKRIISFHRLKMISMWPIKALGIEAIVAEIRGNRSVDDVVSALSQDSRIESVQPIVTFHLLTYNDPYFHLQNATVGGADFERIHDLATGKNVSVALVDTGVDRHHPELAGRIIYAHNFVDHDQDEFDNDEHGTSVAGLIASAANNQLGIVGVAPEAKLMVFKACWQDQETRQAECDSYSIMKALVEVLKQRPDVLNMSLAGPPDPLITRLLAAAYREGIVEVAAVDPRETKSFPASLPEVIAVSAPLYVNAATPKDGLLAPGTDILTTAPGATYAFRSGSSMATAYVSGVAALIKQRQPGISPRALRADLVASSQYSVDAIPVVDICHAVSGKASAKYCPPTDMAVVNRPPRLNSVN